IPAEDRFQAGQPIHFSIKTSSVGERWSPLSNTAAVTIPGDVRLPGDVNGDCKVNVLDLIFIRNRLNASPDTGDNWKADVNEDGKINVLDLIFVRNRLNTQCP
ncbi:MAG TPA: dockerin type I repeat-containing protein, partial [Planctomycetota bacterium]|nr:dockerin type I repeat-containing protein [Planctomycetota bacterium]